MYEKADKLTPTDGLYRTIIFAAIIFALLLSATFLRWGQPGPVLAVLPWFIPVISLFNALTFFCVGFLAIGRYYEMRDIASFRIGMGAAGFSIAITFYALAWPGLLPDGGSIIASTPGAAAWFLQIGLTILSAFFLSAVLVRQSNEKKVPGRRSLIFISVWIVFLIIAFALVARADQYLPVLVTPTGIFTTFLRAWNAAIALIFAGGAVLSTRRYLQTGDSFMGYIAFAQMGFAFTLFATVGGMSRYDFWWYLLRAITTGSALVVLFGLLYEYVRLFRREKEKTAKLRMAENELRKSRARLEAAMASMTDAVLITDGQGQFIDFNEAFATFHRFKNKGECFRMLADYPNFLEAHLPDGTLAALDMWAVPRALRGEAASSVEYALHRMDTDERWVGSYSFGPIHDKDGVIVGSVVVCRDITEQKNMEKALRQSEQHLRDVFDNMVAMIGLLTPDGTLIEVNRRALEIANLKRQDVLNKVFEHCYWWNWSSEEQNRLRGAIDRAAAGQGSRYDAVIRAGENKYRTIDFMLSPMLDPDGRVVYLIPSATDITERKQAEAQIESVARFPAENPSPVMRVNSEGQLLYANLSSQPLLNTWGAQVGQALPVQLVQTAQRVLAKGFPEEKDFIIGSKTFQFSFAPVAKGPYINLYGRDITERKKAEDALRAIQEQLHQQVEEVEKLMDVAPAAIWVCRDAYCQDIKGNRTANRLFEASEHENVSAHTSAVRRFFRNGQELKPEDLPMQVAVAGNTDIRDAEFDVLLPSGKRLSLLGSASPLHDAQASVRGCIGAFLDITQRKAAEHSLRQAAERYEQQVQLFEGVASTTPDFVYIFDLQGRFLYANRRLLEVWGMTLPDAIGKTCRELGYEQWHHDMHMREIAQVIETKRPIKGEVPFEAPITGIFGIYEYIFTPVIGPDGEVQLIAGTTRDVTERKHMEEALRQLNENLEQRVAERTMLAEARAKQLQSLAVELIEAEEKERRKIALILHDDLQQLLASAKMQLQAIADKYSSESDLANVGHLLNESIMNSRRLSHELSPPVLQHSGLVAGLQWLSDQMARRFGLQVDLKASAEQKLSPPLKFLVFRAAQEFLFNIYKHAGIKSAHVDLFKSNGDCVLVVTDQGKGFDPQILHAPHLKAGLGLISIRERTHAIGGSLAVESAPGKGSRFTLSVPFDVDKTLEPQEPPAENLTLDRDDHLYESGSTKTRVLFADDHKVMRQGLIRLISGQPEIQIVGEAANGLEALELARQLRPDVIVMDVSMPEMDGIQATRRIKAQMPEIRIVGLSMYEDEQIVQNMREAGAETFISKTASSAELLKAIYGLRDPAQSCHNGKGVC
jgi:PAS domain S-box-containing protein